MVFFIRQNSYCKFQDFLLENIFGLKKTQVTLQCTVSYIYCTVIDNLIRFSVYKYIYFRGDKNACFCLPCSNTGISTCFWVRELRTNFSLLRLKTLILFWVLYFLKYYPWKLTFLTFQDRQTNQESQKIIKETSSSFKNKRRNYSRAGMSLGLKIRSRNVEDII